MKKRFAFALFAASTIFTSAAIPQTSGTNLVMQAHWDNNSAIQGTVTLGLVNSSGPNTVIATNTLSKGSTSITEALAPNSVYNVTLVDSAGVQLIQFPITTALINPSNLQSAEIAIVCHTADNSLASAKINVSMTF